MKQENIDKLIEAMKVIASVYSENTIDMHDDMRYFIRREALERAEKEAKKLLEQIKLTVE